MGVTEVASSLVGKYLTFGLADEHYGISIARVQEIVGILPVTRVPRMPDFVAGVVNLRGRVIPVVDLRLSFGMPGVPVTDRSCIIVVSVAKGDGGSTVMGVIVDEVSDVAHLTEDLIEPTPEFGIDVDTSFIKGVGRLDERVVLMLDIDKALSGEELDLVESATAQESDSNVEES